MEAATENTQHSLQYTHIAIVYPDFQFESDVLAAQHWQKSGRRCI